MKKRDTFRAIADWAAQQGPAVFGIDANSPETDHPEIARNVYHFDRVAGDQEEHLLHDPSRAPHQMRDAFRRHLGAHPEQLDAIRLARPEGPLAVTHLLRRSGSLRRFDFVFVTPDIRVDSVAYHEDLAASGLCDHPPVVADLTLPSVRRR